MTKPKVEVPPAETQQQVLSPEQMVAIVQSDEDLARAFLEQRVGSQSIESADMDDEATRLDFAKEAILEAYLDPNQSHDDAMSIARRFARTDIDTYLPPSLPPSRSVEKGWAGPMGDIRISDSGSVEVEEARELRADLLPFNILRDAATEMRWQALGVDRASLEPAVARQVEAAFDQARTANAQLLEAQAKIAGVVATPAP